MKYNNLKLRLGKRRKPTSYVKNRRVIVPYGKELKTTGVK